MAYWLLYIDHILANLGLILTQFIKIINILINTVANE